MLAIYIKHSFTHTLESRFCFMNFPYTLEFFAVAFSYYRNLLFEYDMATNLCLLCVDLNENKEDIESISLDRGVC